MKGQQVLVAVCSVLAAAHLAVAVGFLAPFPEARSWWTFAVGVVAVSLYTSLSVLLVRRDDAAAVGVLLGLISLAVAHVVAKEIWLQWLGSTAHPEHQAWLVAVTAEDAWWVATAFALLLLHFPDGRVPSARWRAVPALLVVATAVVQLDGAVSAEPFRAPLEHLARPFGPWPEWWQVVGLVAFVVLLVLLLAAAVSLVLRLRRADDVQRRQLTWLALGGLGLPLYPPLCLLEIAVSGSTQWLSVVVGIGSLLAVPVACGFAVLRHDLYDVDKAFAFAMTWAVVSTVLVLVYVAASTVVGLVVGRRSDLGVAVGTALAAAVLLPVLRTVRRAVDARTYPLRRGVLAAVDALLRDVSAGHARPERLEPVLREALRDPGLRVGFRAPGTDDYLDAAGAPVGGPGLPVRAGEEQIGLLLGGGGPASVELLREVASRAATLVDVVRLRAEVVAALAEAESSRSRLVSAGYEERRRLERDLHDGAQQRLVSLGMSLRLAQRHLGDGGLDLDGLFDESVAQLATAVAELREVAHGLRPSSLDQGLPPALVALADSASVPIDVVIDADDAIPDDLAVTAYFVVSEAVANVVKHAAASQIRLRVAQDTDRLRVSIEDDGCGGAVARPGSGLAGIADRVAAAGGSLRIDSEPRAGTRLEVSLPCAW